MSTVIFEKYGVEIDVAPVLVLVIVYAITLCAFGEDREVLVTVM